MSAAELAPAAPQPDANYVNPDGFTREKQRLFTAAWLLFAPRRALGKPGDYLALTLGGWPLVALVDETSEIRVFRNICRHQGLPLFDKGGGNCDGVRCRYHGWRYDLKGEFAGAPDASAPPDPADPMHALQAVALLEWQGLLFVHLGRAPVPEPVVPADVVLAGLPLRDEQSVELAANWKVAVEQHLQAPLAAAATRTLHWPNLVIERTAAGIILTQFLPNTFQRTRLLRLAYGGDADAATPAMTETLAEEKRAAEARHAAFLTNQPPAPENAAVGAFRVMIQRIHAA